MRSLLLYSGRYVKGEHADIKANMLYTAKIYMPQRVIRIDLLF